MENQKRRWKRRIIVLLIGNSIFTAVLAAAAFVWGWTSFAGGLPDLAPWHQEAPAAEFTEEDETPAYDFDDYLAQEDDVFAELETLAATWPPARYSRFNPESVCYPDSAADRNWNRSLLRTAETPRGGVLLVHGLSDSPYSLRVIGETLHERGWTVMWLRVPGHGTCPAALAETSKNDWAAAVRIAARSLRAALPDDAPLVLGGFSNGGALCVDYAAAAIDDPDLPRADRLFLISPMIGITGLARTTELYPVVGRISGLDKVAWSRLEPEIDPFKYSSWPMNASVQAWRMTQRTEQRLRELHAAGRMPEFPPVIAFQSAVDATVVVPRLISRLFDRVAPPADARTPASELVLYDVNRTTAIEEFIDTRFETQLIPLLERNEGAYHLTVVANRSPDSHELIERRATRDGRTETPLDLAWPRDVFSLSHGGLPIPASDPVLGAPRLGGGEALPLGDLSLRGEHGVLAISESLMMRLRFNPFYPHLEQRLLEWLEAPTE